MSKPQSPCLGCGTRQAGCQSVCIRYQDFRKALDEYNELVRERKEKDAAVLVPKTRSRLRDRRKR